MNLRAVMRKLQTALSVKGRHIRINQFQKYSERADRMVTRYVVQETMRCDDGVTRLITHIETYGVADVVKKLAEIYGEINT